jgi:hypothetical protein
MTEHSKKPLFLIEGRAVSAADIAGLFQALTGRQPDPQEMAVVEKMLEAKLSQGRSSR